MGEEMSEAELANLLAAQPDQGTEDGSAQIIDSEGNTVTVSASQMASVGIDPNNMSGITEDQIASLLSIASNGSHDRKSEEVRSAAQMSSVGIDPNNMSGITEDQIASLLSIASNGSHDRKSEEVRSAAQMASVGIDPNNMSGITEDQIASLLSIASNGSHDRKSEEGGSGEGDLTMVIGEDGSLKLVDPSGAESLLSPSELAAAGVDISNLDEEAVQTIVQLAMGKDSFRKKGTEEPATKRLRSELDYAAQDDGTLRLLDHNGQELQVAVADHMPSSHPSRPAARPAPASRSPGSLSLIGKEVEVRKDGRLQTAVIRYCRQGAGLKCQFEDGHFEWVQEDQVTMKGSKSGVKEVMGHKSASPSKPVLNGPTTNSVSSALSRRLPPAIPGIRVTPQAESGHSQSRCGEPNFVCPICEAKVYQKEPAYIVIRLPACETCADSKILVLDQSESAAEETKDPEPS